MESDSTIGNIGYKAILVHWAEIALKGKNRPKFVDRLAGNVRKAMAGLPVAEVRRLPSRLWITAHGGHTFGPEALARLDSVFGISSYSPVVRCPLDLQAMKETALLLAERHTYESFRITARRAFKNLPFRSQEVASAVGAHVLEHRPAKVKMKGADLDIRIEILPQGAYLYTEKITGRLGLPVGVTGKVCVLLSGGIDSPVAAFRMQRRGCRVVLVHFHSHPFVTKASLEKAEELAEVLARFQNDVRFYAVPFGELQRAVVDHVPAPLRVILYRRFMLRIAGDLGASEGCRALVTGEALAQVASQTLANLVAIDEAAPMVVLRPLIGLDKQEIVSQAQDLGTFEISIQPDQDCCTLFTPKHPQTHASLDEVREAEADLDIGALVTRAVAGAERRTIYAPWAGKPRDTDQRAEETAT